MTLPWKYRGQLMVYEFKLSWIYLSSGMLDISSQAELICNVYWPIYWTFTAWTMPPALLTLWRLSLSACTYQRRLKTYVKSHHWPISMLSSSLYTYLFDSFPQSSIPWCFSFDPPADLGTEQGSHPYGGSRPNPLDLVAESLLRQGPRICIFNRLLKKCCSC